MKVTGKITKINYLSGESKDGKKWEKVSFVLTTDEKYNNIYPMYVFGSDKVQSFKKNVKPAQDVEVQFNVKAREWNDKYFTDLEAWNIKPLEGVQEFPDNNDTDDVSDGLPF